MASLTRDRSCLYYIPWIATACVAFGAAALAIWIDYTRKCRNHTLDALDALNVGARHLDRFDDALLATSISYVVMLVLIYLMTFWRSFIEAAHDATGTTSGSSLAFLFIAVLFEVGWFFMMCWLVLLLIANSLWAAFVYLCLGAIKQSIMDLALWGGAVWIPSQNQPCPGQCFDLTHFVFITSEFKDACVCDPDQLAVARDAFQQAYDDVPGVTTGNWVMFVAGLCLLLDFACQYSQTRRERELLLRVNTKVYSSI